MAEEFYGNTPKDPNLNNEVVVSVKEVNGGECMGTFFDKWDGKWNKKDKFEYSIGFSEDNSKVTLEYKCTGAKHTDATPQLDHLHIAFDVKEVRKLDAKLTFVLHNGAGSWDRADRYILLHFCLFFSFFTNGKSNPGAITFLDMSVLCSEYLYDYFVMFFLISITLVVGPRRKELVDTRTSKTWR